MSVWVVVLSLKESVLFASMFKRKPEGELIKADSSWLTESFPFFDTVLWVSDLRTKVIVPLYRQMLCMVKWSLR
jgi:hypothetical protein